MSVSANSLLWSVVISFAALDVLKWVVDGRGEAFSPIKLCLPHYVVWYLARREGGRERERERERGREGERERDDPVIVHS